MVKLNTSPSATQASKVYSTDDRHSTGYGGYQNVFGGFNLTIESNFEWPEWYAFSGFSWVLLSGICACRRVLGTGTSILKSSVFVLNCMSYIRNCLFNNSN